MTNAPKPTPPTAGLTLPRLPVAPDVAPDDLGHVAAALTLMARADQHAADAMACRALDDHPMAGRFAERERMCLKRADLLVAIAQADALADLSDAARRIALAL